MADGREALHVDANLRHDYPRRRGTHTRDGHEPFDDTTQGFERSLDLRLELGLGLFQVFNPLQVLLEQEA